MKYALIWAVLTIGPQGPVGGNIPENIKFDTQAACEEFGQKMTLRMQDWVRGVLKADWDHPVRVEFKCEAPGNPA